MLLLQWRWWNIFILSKIQYYTNFIEKVSENFKQKIIQSEDTKQYYNPLCVTNPTSVVFCLNFFLFTQNKWKNDLDFYYYFHIPNTIRIKKKKKKPTSFNVFLAAHCKNKIFLLSVFLFFLHQKKKRLDRYIHHRLISLLLSLLLLFLTKCIMIICEKKKRTPLSKMY